MQLGWTRDEILLVVACILVNQNSDAIPSHAIRELSDELKALPIHPLTKRDPGFRTVSGLSGQLWYLNDSIRKGKKNTHISSAFINTYQQALENPQHYIDVADAIKRCQPIYKDVTFGCAEETYDFPEGAILFHTHRYFKRRDGKSSQAPQCCQLCGVSADLSYSANIPLIEPHLMVPPTKMQPTAVYKASDFIYVCPNCHRALHLLRPWRSNVQECETILYE